MTVKSQKLATIQALRGIAASLIVVLHAFHEAKLGAAPKMLSVGVDIFFVISGFIMVYTSRNYFGAAGAWKRFVAHRLVRIVPVYWFYTSVLIAVAFVMPRALDTVKFAPVHALLSYFFIPHLNPGGGLHPFLDLGWTLNYEMYFYAVFAALLFLPMRRMLIVLTAFFAASVVAGFYLDEVAAPALFFWSRPIVLEFVAGAWIGYAYVRGHQLSPGRAAGLIGLGVFLLFAEYNPLHERSLNLMAASALFVMAAILPAGMDKERVPRWLQGLGDGSYTLYLSHPFTLAAGGLVLRRFLPPGGVFAVSILLAISMGYILYFIVEKPLLSLTKRVFLKA